MARGPEIARELARALGGTSRELPSEGPASTSIVALADAGVPLLVRDFGHVIWIYLAGTRSWATAPLAEIAAATRAWATDSSRPPTMLAVLAELADYLPTHTGGAWVVSLPGVPQPRESWLHPRVGSASVGVFDDAVRVSVGDPTGAESLALASWSAGDLAKVGAAVDAQLRAHARNLAVSERIEALAERLVPRLEARLGQPCVRASKYAVSHYSSSDLELRFGPDAVRMVGRGDDVVVSAGLVGADGWTGIGEDVEAMLEPIVEAMQRARRSLTIERLVVGRHYRVLADLQELRRGMIVRFDGFDDIDNHYGRYEFTTSAGVAVRVAGDFSTPRNSPLGETHRYLEEVGD